MLSVHNSSLPVQCCSDFSKKNNYCKIFVWEGKQFCEGGTNSKICYLPFRRTDTVFDDNCQDNFAYYAPNFEKVDGAYCFWSVRGCVRGWVCAWVTLFVPTVTFKPLKLES